MTYLQAIAKRVSVRTFTNEALTQIEKDRIQVLVEGTDPGTVSGVASSSILRWDLVDSLATFGIIRGAASYLVPVVKKGLVGTELAQALTEIGYRMEKIVLELTRSGLGTCWLGGTFRKGSLADVVKLGPEEAVYAVLAIGNGTGKRALMDAFIANSAGSTKRKDPLELFFNLDAGKAFSELGEEGEVPPAKPGSASKNAGLESILKAVRQAPSASNKQPWRLLVSQSGAEAGAGEGGVKVDLYLDRDERYEKLATYPIPYVDGGIACCHIELAAKELGITAVQRAVPLSPTKESEAWLAGMKKAEFVMGWELG